MFALDPPKATVPVLRDDRSEVHDFVTLQKPNLNGTSLTFDVAILDGRPRSTSLRR